MLCHQCGAGIGAGVQSCPHCGAAQAAQPERADGQAIGSLLCGILSVLILPFLMSIPAVILGHMSRARIRRSGGQLQGDGMAMAGLVLGYGSFAFFGLVLVLILIGLPGVIRSSRHEELAATSTLRTLNTIQITYFTKYPANGYAPDLATLGPGPTGACAETPSAENACLVDGALGNPRCRAGEWCAREGYKYSIRTEGQPVTDYVLMATPARRGSRNKTFCSTSDGIIRQRKGARLASPNLTVAQCRAWPEF